MLAGRAGRCREQQLAGGEFPFPMLQSATAGNAVTVQFRDFGIKLRFTPTIQKNGAIRLLNAPATKVVRVISEPAAKLARVFGAYGAKEAA